MHLENQVISLDLAKRLKELNVKQQSLFYWADKSIVSSIDLDLLLDNGKVRSLSCVNNSWPDQVVVDLYSAFTVSELCDILPVKFTWIDKNENESCENVYLDIKKYDDSYGISYVDLDDTWFDWELIQDKSLPNGLGKMLVYLIEKGLFEDATNN